MAVTQKGVRKTEIGLEGIGTQFHPLCNFVCNWLPKYRDIGEFYFLVSNAMGQNAQECGTSDLVHLMVVNPLT